MLEWFFHTFSNGVATYTMGWRLLSVVENLEKDIFQCALHAILLSYGDVPSMLVRALIVLLDVRPSLPKMSRVSSTR